MNFPQGTIFSHIGIAIVGLGVVALASGFAPPPGKGGGALVY